LKAVGLGVHRLSYGFAHGLVASRVAQFGGALLDALAALSQAESLLLWSGLVRLDTTGPVRSAWLRPQTRRGTQNTTPLW
jgi:hypothetical protein